MASVLGLLAGLGVWTGVLGAEPPRVVVAVPDHGDVGIDPAVGQVRIEFDQDMSPDGLSICGSGPSFPALQGKPAWETARVLVMNVSLQPGHEYQMSVNCPAFRNTRSALGEPAEITPIWFSTADRAGASGPVELTPEQCRAAVGELRKAIDEKYSYRDRVVKDWDAAFAAHRAALEGSKTRAQFARECARLLTEAEDPHVFLRIGRAPFGAYSNPSPPYFNLDTLSRAVPGWERHNDVVYTGRFADGIGYLLISSWTSDQSLLKPALEFIGALGEGPGLVIDVRPNGGGDERTARLVAQCFTKEKAVYSRSRTRSPDEPGGFTGLFGRSIAPYGETRYGGRVVVLMGPANLSSNESFLLMMRYGAGAALVGDRSMGSSGNPRPVELSCGVTVLLPSWQDFLADGTMLEGRGIDPDVRVGVTAEELKQRDPVLEAGLRRVRGQE